MNSVAEVLAVSFAPTGADKSAHVNASQMCDMLDLRVIVMSDHACLSDNATFRLPEGHAFRSNPLEGVLVANILEPAITRQSLARTSRDAACKCSSRCQAYRT